MKLISSLEELNTIKTQKCTNEQCQYFQCISNPTRQKFYKPIFTSDKYAFNCFNYHTEHDKRRKPFKQTSITQLNINQNDLQYSGIYLTKQQHNISNVQIVQKNNDLFQKYCHNFIQYLYHPTIYKTIPCSQLNKCKYTYCPFIHQSQIIKDDIKCKLNLFRQVQSTNFGDNKSNSIIKQFQQKIYEIKLLKNMKNNPIKNSENVDPSQQINQIKQKLMKKVDQCIKIDQKKQLQQESRKILQGQVGVFGQIKKIQAQNQNLAFSYNYFNYGQRLPLVEGRQIEFKHFKDISDPNHIPLIMKYIAAFLNSQGGKFYIGIDDNSYVYGTRFKQSEYDKLLLNIDREGKFNMTPPVMPQRYEIRRIPVYHERKGQQRWVIQLTVYPSSPQNKRLFLYNRQCYMRMNASTHKLNASDLIQFFSMNPNAQSIEYGPMGQTFGDDKVYEKKTLEKKQQVSKLVNEQKQSYHENNLMKNIRKASNQLAYTNKNRSQQKTQNINTKQFQSSLQQKSLEELNSLKKEYQHKLELIKLIYQNKQRQMR